MRGGKLARTLFVAPRRDLSSYVEGGWVEGFSGAVGNTPLIKLDKLCKMHTDVVVSIVGYVVVDGRGALFLCNNYADDFPPKETQCTILAKAEFMNPGGSIKDRAALFIIRDAEDAGTLRPGGTIVEGTAGNTGIGLAHVCQARGYQCKIFIPDTQSEEKIHTLRSLGAEVFAVPAVPYDNEMNFNHQARRYAETRDNHVWTDQFDNVANRYGHFMTTGPEILRQAPSVDVFTCASGTGGTYAGVSMYLREKLQNNVKLVLADPPGSVLCSYFTHGTLEREGSSITEGIGQGRVTANLKGAPVDSSMTIDDEKSIRMVFRLLLDEGLFVAASSGLNVAAAVEMANKLGPGHTIVTMLCDSAARYQSRLFSASWLEQKGLLSCLDPEMKALLNE